jgi:hypothetical protein
VSVVAGATSLPRLYNRGRVALLILALLGLLSFAAARDITGQCRTTNEYLTGGGKLLSGGAQLLTTGKKITRCELTGWGWLRLAVSERTAEILCEFGIPVSYIQ